MELFLTSLSQPLLLASCLIILVSSVILTFKTRFVQFRMLPQMLSHLAALMWRRRDAAETSETIQAHKALFTAMSTTVGISTIVSPVIAIYLGGPGALVGFLLTTIFGTAANYAEVTFALSYRKRGSDGTVQGGPMQYLKDAIHPFMGRWYAFCCLILMVAWSSAQANQLADMLNSHLLGDYHVPSYITGVFLAIFVTAILIGGIKRIGNFSEKLVPAMFFLYVGAAFWIIFTNLSLLPGIFYAIFESLFSPIALAGGAAIGTIANALRWGVFKGVQSSEAGIGTSTIPHSMAEAKSPQLQGLLSMVGTYSSGFIALLSGIVALITETWKRPDLPLGINMVAESFNIYFSWVGTVIVILCVFLFAFGTILGNSFNGSHCFNFLSNNRHVNYYYLASAVVIFLGAISDVTMVWTVIDFFLIPMAVPHILSIVWLAFRRSDLLEATLHARPATGTR